MIIKFLKYGSILLLANTCFAQMQSIEEDDMAQISGQGGVYLTGEFSINKDGGPLWGATAGQFDEFGVEKQVRNCGTSLAPKECGLRFAIKLNENSEGWYVIDDISGGFSFEGLTLRTETLTSVPNYESVSLIGGEAVAATVDLTNGGLSSGVEVVQIGLPGTVSFNDFRFKFAVANNGEFGVPTVDGSGAPVAFKQTEIFGIQLNGNITLDGNLLLFPVD